MAELPEMDPLKIAERERQERIGKQQELMVEGISLFDSWTQLAFQEPPEDILGRILWSAGILGQLVVSTFTFPAALGAFLLEEAVQTYGMGAFMLSQAKAYETLDTYIDGWKSFIEGAKTGAKTLATLSPITGGAVLMYMDAAEISALAFEAANDANLLKQAEKDEALRLKLLEQQEFGSLRLQSSPSQATIFINGEDVQLLTPETFPRLDPGPYVFLLKKFSAARQVEETLEFPLTIEAGRKKEVFARIPKIIDGETEPGEDPIESDEPQLPVFIKAEVTGDHAIDGDTFTTTTGERIRVLAIDSPEIDRPWGEEAKEALGLLVEDKKIQLRIQSHKPLDEFGRTLAIASSWKGDIAVFQLSSGLARVSIFPDDLYDPTKYIAAEQVAKDRGIGIWS